MIPARTGREKDGGSERLIYDIKGGTNFRIFYTITPLMELKRKRLPIDTK